MKYYSEDLKKVFDTEKELEVAEKEAKQLEAKKAENKAIVSKEKKHAADLVKLADKEVEKAESDYADVVVKTNKMLKDARTKVHEARKNSCNTIRAFNDKYGPYTEVYTGEKAKKEFENFDILDKYIDSWFDFFI